jgi:hypothetical protein
MRGINPKNVGIKDEAKVKSKRVVWMGGYRSIDAWRPQCKMKD